MNFKKSENFWFIRCIHAVVLVCLFSGQILPPSVALAQSASGLNLPVPGAMVGMSPHYVPIAIKGIKIFPENPFRFDFILDTGNSKLDQERLNEETRLLVKYFLTALTIPDSDQWVNLSPFENDRIIPDGFGITEMGRDLLAQDYLLKQLTASLVYPEHALGKRFWETVYRKAYEKYGDVDIPVSTFNKVWVMPAHAKVYEYGNTAVITESRLRVLLEEDYLAMRESNGKSTDIGPLTAESKDVNNFGSAIVREIVLPEIEREINEGKNFIKLRQIYHSMIMAAWFKKKLKDSILGKMYVGANKVAGVEAADKRSKEKIYERYLAAFKKGVYNYIREDVDLKTNEVVPRKYFSGGVVAGAEVVRTTEFVPVEPVQLAAAANTMVGESLTVAVGLDVVDSAGNALNDTSKSGDIATIDGAKLQSDIKVFDETAVGAILRAVEEQNAQFARARQLAISKVQAAWRSTGETEGALGYEIGRLVSAAFDSIIERFYSLQGDIVRQEAYLREAKVTFTYSMDARTGYFKASLSDPGVGIDREILDRTRSSTAPAQRLTGDRAFAVIRNLLGGAMGYNLWDEITIVSKTRDAQNGYRLNTRPAGQSTLNDYFTEMESGTEITISGRSLTWIARNRSTLGGALKQIGILGQDESARVSKETLRRWQQLADAQTLQVRSIAGETINAKFIQSEIVDTNNGRMPDGIYAYHFRDDQGQLVIVLSNQLDPQDINEAVYHEFREDYWENVLAARAARNELSAEDQARISWLAHVLASADQSVTLGAERNAITTYHQKQLRSLETQQLEALIAEDRQLHQQVIRQYLTREQFEKYVQYEQMMRAELITLLANRRAGNQVDLQLPVFPRIDRDVFRSKENRGGILAELRQSFIDQIREAYRTTGETQGALGYELGRLASRVFDSVVERYDQLAGDPARQDAFVQDAKVVFSFTRDPQYGKISVSLTDNGAGISRDLLVRLSGNRNTSEDINRIGEEVFWMVQSLLGGTMAYNLWDEIEIISRTQNDRMAYRYTTGKAGQASVNDYFSSIETGTTIKITGRSLSWVEQRYSQLGQLSNDNVTDETGSAELQGGETRPDSSKDLGGIDMNASALDLQIEGSVIEFDMPFDPKQWGDIKFDGLTPVILQIKTTNLPLFIGANQADQPIQLSSV